MDFSRTIGRSHSVLWGDFVRGLKRNKRRFYYCLYDHKIPLVDEYGNESGEGIIVYGEAAEMWANISPASGFAQTEQFGNLENYDKVIVTDWLNCPIDENSVLFIDKEPEFVEADTNRLTESSTLFGNDTITPLTVEVPVYDYTVRRVAKSLNGIAIAVSKVKVS